ncbi:MAG: DUF1924 domain-containing protein [Myxococcota bacterium]|nr:DUF1924 domain-containing protein [Myxococcota bacterium]
MQRKVKVWDLAVRLGHWAMGGLVLGAFLTSEEDDWIPVHARIGLALLGIVIFRGVWGFVGTRHARFRDFVRSPAEVLAYAREYARGEVRAHLGHNPLGGAMVVAMLVALLTVTATGIAVYLGPEWGGPLSAVFTRRTAHGIKEVHEAAAWVLPWLVAFHVAGVLLSSFLEKQNLVWGMVTGFKRAPDGRPPTEPPLSARIAGLIAAVAMSVGVIVALAKLFPIPEAEAAPRPALLEDYQREAQAETPSFSADPQRGRALYFIEHDKNGKPTSCATCHTDDARRPGKSPVGKLIEPLAPSANPDRFTDRKQADRWYDRNCKQVLGRVCTPGEKADFLSYLLTLSSEGRR